MRRGVSSTAVLTATSSTHEHDSPEASSPSRTVAPVASTWAFVQDQDDVWRVLVRFVVVPARTVDGFGKQAAAARIGGDGGRATTDGAGSRVTTHVATRRQLRGSGAVDRSTAVLYVTPALSCSGVCTKGSATGTLPHKTQRLAP